jgi:hypothetical protein
MTYKTENNRVFDTKKILVIAAGFLAFTQMLVILHTGLVTILEIPGSIMRCAGIFDEGFPWIMVIHFLYHTILLLCGIAADLALNRLVIYVLSFYLPKSCFRILISYFEL